MAELPPPFVIFENETGWHFTGEETGWSKIYVQNLLTRFGRNFARWSRRSNYRKERSTPNLRRNRMRFLKNADKVRVRNGFDLEAIPYLVNSRIFFGAIQLRHEAQREFLRERIDANLVGYVDGAVISDDTSDDEDFWVKRDDEGSLSRYDSDCKVRSKKHIKKREILREQKRRKKKHQETEEVLPESEWEEVADDDGSEEIEFCSESPEAEETTSSSDSE